MKRKVRKSTVSILIACFFIVSFTLSAYAENVVWNDSFQGNKVWLSAKDSIYSKDILEATDWKLERNSQTVSDTVYNSIYNGQLPTASSIKINESFIGEDVAVFIPNKGQIDDQVSYYTDIFSGKLFVEKDGSLTYLINFNERDEIDEPSNDEKFSISSC